MQIQNSNVVYDMHILKSYHDQGFTKVVSKSKDKNLERTNVYNIHSMIDSHSAI